ncbi:helix-turn-helix domain-containing protein [[Mycobacterium] burgundiense]|uniref:helix-turn-helix domain-containing protein n=1 Tax=[Mycobacterium] burgundiense TaxID=3064286 RepID=UPI003AA8A91F
MRAIADRRSPIADRLGRAPSTISRELRRNTPVGRTYQPFEAHRRATHRWPDGYSGAQCHGRLRPTRTGLTGTP